MSSLGRDLTLAGRFLVIQILGKAQAGQNKNWKYRTQMHRCLDSNNVKIVVIEKLDMLRQLCEAL